ncbi:hypothetical protein [Candidatus Methylocalor cossyra]|uniref:Uncharacterized protein n=1 Tax=Candidatus Methylocalor cossyra TaxID=3108543 RepID=A0ABM9NGB4_9GAMM
MHWNKLVRTCMAGPLLLPGAALALVVEVQGVRLEPPMVGASCVDIAGVYPGVRIEADKPGQTPRVCHNAARVNSISITNATLIALPPANREIVLKFEHEFPPGVNGRIMARAKLQGFFATANGVGVPSGDRLNLTAYFSQGTSDDVIADPLDFKVGDQLESALFDYSVKKQYLTAGPRALKGLLKVTFAAPGHKVTFPERCLISLDTGSTFEDKLDTMETLGEAAPGPEGGEAGGGEAPEAAAPEAAKPEAPAGPGRLPPFPNLPPLGPIPPGQ